MGEASAIFALDRVSGKPIAEMPDPNAELFSYLVLRPAAPPAGSVFARVFRKLHGPRAGNEYTVRLTREGAWECDCGDWTAGRFARRRPYARGSFCKHIRCAIQAWRLSESL